MTFGIGSAAGSMFTQAATGFWQGAVQGAIVGSITGAGGAIVNGIFNGGNITLKEVLGGALIGGAIGAIIGGIRGGLNAKEGDASFWTGNKTLDTSKGVGAHSSAAQKIVAQGSLKGKYVGKYEGVKIYENADLGSGRISDGLTLPPDEIIVGKGTYSLLAKDDYVRDLFRHEFGHILQSRQSFVGLGGFYRVIGPESAYSAAKNGWIQLDGTKYRHATFWTETWANDLSNNYFGPNAFIYKNEFPIESLSKINFLKFIGSKIAPF